MRDISSTEVPPPGYVARKPLYPAVKSLNLEAGMQDTMINLAELSIRHFERSMSASPDAEAFVRTSCKEYGINSSLAVEWADVRANAHRSAIVQAVSIADSFVRRLSREYRSFRGILDQPWKTQKGDLRLDPLTALTENLPRDGRRMARECPEFDLWNYYRLIRNRIIHKKATDTGSALVSLIDNHESHFGHCYGSLPSEFDNIGYDDFLLFTRAVKYYANVLNDVCDLRPSHVVTRVLANESFVARLRRCKNRLNQLRKICNQVTEVYALSESESEVVFEGLESFLKADPTSKIRKRMQGN